jgi:site-specific recombinase XerC
VRAGQSPRSIARRLSCWRRFLDRWCSRSLSPIRHACAFAHRAVCPKALSPDQATALVSEAADRFESVRDAALLRLLYSSGLRLSG